MTIKIDAAGFTEAYGTAGEVVDRVVAVRKSKRKPEGLGAMLDSFPLLDVKLLIDGDIVAYRAAAATDGRKYTIPSSTKTFEFKKQAVKYCKENDIDQTLIEISYEPESLPNACVIVDRTMQGFRNTFEGAKSVSIEVFLTPKANFRNDVDSGYKMNRKDVHRPEHLTACKIHLVQQYGATTIDGYEADDLLGIRQTELNAGVEDIKPVICTIDKDLDMIPGWHYNWIKNKVYYVTPEEGLYNFYIQLLTGDATDNIPGLYRVGKVTAAKILKGIKRTDEVMYPVVLQEYIERTKREEEEETDIDFYTRVITTITRNARLLWICRYWGEVWTPPILELKEVD